MLPVKTPHGELGDGDRLALREALHEALGEALGGALTDAMDVPLSDDPNVGENETVCVLEVDLVYVKVFVDVFDCDCEYVLELD